MKATRRGGLLAEMRAIQTVLQMRNGGAPIGFLVAFRQVVQALLRKGVVCAYWNLGKKQTSGELMKISIIYVKYVTHLI